MASWIGLVVLVTFVMLGCGADPAPSSLSAERIGTTTQAQTIVNVSPNSTLGPFGRPNSLTFGQTVTVPPVDSVLTSFSFVMNVSDTMKFRGHVFEWSGTRASGRSLWDGPTVSTNGANNQMVIFTPGIVLTAGTQYVLFASCVDDAFSNVTGTWASNSNNPYPGGTAAWLNHSNASQWTTLDWDTTTYSDMAFTAQFDSLATSTTTIDSSLTPSAFGQPLTFTATVTGAGAAPTGAVTFKDGTTTLATASLNGTGKASLSTTTLSVGSHSVTAVYGGDSRYSASTSAALTQVVNAASTTTLLASSVNPSLVNRSVTLSATVTSTAPGTGTPSGTVTFREGSTVLGSGTLDASGVAKFATSALSLGEHKLTAAYGGGTSFNASTSSELAQNVALDGAVVTVASAPLFSTFGDEVTFTATVTGSSGTPTGTVTYKNGATSLGTTTLANGVASIKTSTLPVGANTVTAEYGGSAGYAPVTGTVTHTVAKAATSTTLVSPATTSFVGDKVTFTATITSNAAGFTGEVEFFDVATSLGKSTLGNGKASFESTMLREGAHSVTATYLGDANFATSTSAVLTQTVGAKPTPERPGPGPGNDIDAADASTRDAPAASAAENARGCSQAPVSTSRMALLGLACALALLTHRRRAYGVR